MVTGPEGREITNVASAGALKFACGSPFGTFEWLDGMPVTFNYPMAQTPDKEAVEVELSDGSLTRPVCVLDGPANEANEKDTLLILGKFGDGGVDSVWPVRVSVTGKLVLAGPEGELDAQGITFSSPLDMRYTSSSVHMVYARMWAEADFDEGTG